MYTNLLNLRYVQSVHLRRVLSDLKAIGFRLTAHPRCPSLARVGWTKFVQLLERFNPLNQQR